MSTTFPSDDTHAPPGESLKARLGRAIAVHPVTKAIDAWYSDSLGNISRPKLLFTLAASDIALFSLASILATSLLGDGLTMPWALITAAMSIAVLVLMRRRWAYTVRALGRANEQVSKVVSTLLTVFTVSAGTAHLAGVTFPSPAATLLWLVLALIFLTGTRFLLQPIAHKLTASGRLVRRTIIVGGGPDAEAVIRELEGDTSHEVQILGIFDDRFDDRSSDSIMGYAKLGNFDQLEDFCRRSGVELLLITVPVSAEERLLYILKRMFTLSVDVRISALSSKLRLSSRAYSYIGNVPVLTVMDKPLTDWDRVVKNVTDRVIALALLVLASPIMIATAIAVRLDSKGPIFFRQRRYGFNSELIEVWKFRSLRVESQDSNAGTLVTKGDSRVTRVGRFIRKTSIDELPQLFNVLQGTMSLVGPRPHATQAKADQDLYENVVNGYFARHRVKPGVTGWAQINGWRGETDTHEKIQRRVEADLYYIENWSVPLDLYVIAMTPVALFSQKNAY